MNAVGIHAHEHFKLGRRPPKNARALELAPLLKALPAVPVAEDHFAGATFGLYENDRFGDCGPTSVANLVRLVSKAIAGGEVVPSQQDVFDLYRRSGNPDFNPATGAGDNGVDMQTMLEALMSGGIGDGLGGRITPVAFAKVKVDSDQELEAAVAIFGGCLWGVNLLTAQQAQTDQSPPRWDYESSQEWGGHAVLNGKYTGSGSNEEVISWDLDVETTEQFRARQLEEAWIVIFPWHLTHPAFLEGIDVQALADAFKQLTGRDLPVPQPGPIPTPTPTPTPDPGPPAGDADAQLWAELEQWAHARHEGANHRAASAVLAWARGKGFTA